MATKYTRRTEWEDESGPLNIIVLATTEQPIIEIRIGRSSRSGKALIYYPLIHDCTAERAAMVYDLLGAAIQIARDIDQSGETDGAR